MKQSKSTKQAFLMSVLAMLLCVTMLVGTTMAWFTDSVTTGKNKIVAGNLDVELEYASAFNDDGTVKTWTPVNETVSLFRDVEADGTTANLWEPGHTEVVYLRIRNAGTLALKYKFTVTGNDTQTGTSVDGKEIKLSEHLVFGQVERDTEIAKFADREAAWAAVADAEKGLKEFNKESLELLPKAQEYVALVVYMPTTVGNEANYRGSDIPTIELGVSLEAAQTPHEEDSFGNSYDEAAEYEMGSAARVDALVEQGYVPATNVTELRKAANDGEKVVLAGDVTLTKELVVNNSATIDLNGHTLTTFSTEENALRVTNGTVTVRNGTIEASTKPAALNSAVFATGDSTVTIENCTLKTNSNVSGVVVTNGAESLNTTIVIKNSTISAPTVSGKKGYAAYIPAGNVTFENCDVTGHVLITGGDVTLDGGTYTATGFNTQSKIWHKDDTITYVGNQGGGAAFNMGDSILIADRRDGYTLSGLTIRNITFNTEIPNVGTAYAIKYVDMNQNGAESRVPYVIENNTFNQQIDGKDPVMFIDLAGNDLQNP